MACLFLVFLSVEPFSSVQALQARFTSSSSFSTRSTRSSRLASADSASLDALDGQSAQFLKSIKDYGDARMARRSIKVLENMREKDLKPTELHYTATIQACEKSDRYQQALEIYGEMKADGVSRTIDTYVALVSSAEKVSLTLKP